MELRKFGKKDHVILFFGIALQIHAIADFLLTLLAFRALRTLGGFIPAA